MGNRDGVGSAKRRVSGDISRVHVKHALGIVINFVGSHVGVAEPWTYDFLEALWATLSGEESTPTPIEAQPSRQPTIGDALRALQTIGGYVQRHLDPTEKRKYLGSLQSLKANLEAADDEPKRLPAPSHTRSGSMAGDEKDRRGHTGAKRFKVAFETQFLVERFIERLSWTLPVETADTAKHVYGIAEKEPEFQREDLPLLIAGCILLACQQRGEDWSYSGLRKLTGGPKKDIVGMFNKLTDFFLAGEVTVGPGGFVDGVFTYRPSGHLRWKPELEDREDRAKMSARLARQASLPSRLSSTKQRGREVDLLKSVFVDPAPPGKLFREEPIQEPDKAAGPRFAWDMTPGGGFKPARAGFVGEQGRGHEDGIRRSIGTLFGGKPLFRG